MTQPILTVEVDSSGATVTIDPDVSLVPQIVYLKPDGAPQISLAGNWSIAFSADPGEGNQTTFIWFGGDIDLNGFTFQIQSQTITQEKLDANGAFTATTVDESGTQQYVYVPDFNTAGALDGTAIVIGTLPLDRIVTVPDANLLTGNGLEVIGAPVTGDIGFTQTAGNLITAIQPDTVENAMLKDLASGYLKVGDGSNRPDDVQMSGDVTMSNAGVTTIGDGVVTPQMLSFSTGVVAVAQLTLSSAEILALNSTPLEIVASPGVGSSIVVINAVAAQTFVAAAYTTNLILQVYTDTATIPQAANACLDFSGTRTVQLDIGANVFAAADTQIISNKGLFVNVLTGDPAAGDGTIVLTVYYIVLNG